MGAKAKGFKVGRLPLLLVGLLLLGSIVAIIVLAVLYVQQGAELTEVLKTTVNPNRTTAITSATTATTGPPVATTIYPVRQSYRLPSNVVPVSYNLYLQVFLPFNSNEINTTRDAFTTFGKVSIDVKCSVPTNVIVLHAFDLTIQPGHVFVANWRNQNLKIRGTQTDATRQYFIIELEQDLEGGRNYRIDIRYTGLIATETDGLYRSKYTLPDGETRWLAATQFQPHKARRMFPCFDEPALRATFQFTIKHDSRHKVYSVRRAVSSVTFKDDPSWSETRFERTIKMPAYLLALLVSDFERNSKTTTDGLDFGVIARRAALADADFALEVGVKMTEDAGAMFNMMYKEYNSKLDMAAVPDFSAGAMENWGLILYREVYMLYRQGFSAAEDKVQIAKVVAHELAHQWFGNPVTCSWWSEAFLNEGLASYLEIPMVEKARPRWNLKDMFVTSVSRVAFDADAYETSVPLYNPAVNTPAEIGNMFGRITYQKGAAIMRMIEGQMGTVNLYRALSNYLRERQLAGGTTTYRILLNALTNQITTDGSPLDVNDLFDAWISTSGFPLVTVTVSADQPEFTVTQERFLLGNGPHAPGAATRAWNIPFTYITKDTAGESEADLLAKQQDLKSKHWFKKSEGTMTVELPVPPTPKPQWILANIQSSGFYRVNYDPANWQALADQLIGDHKAIHMFSRVQLIEDSFSLARKGLVDYEVVIKLISYIEREAEYPPWSSAIDGLQYLDSMLRTGTIDALVRFVHQKVVGPIYNNNFWDSTTAWVDDGPDSSGQEDYQKLSFRLAVVETACYHGVVQCHQEAINEFDEWKDSPAAPIDPHFKDKIFCYAVRAGGDTFFDYLQQQYRATDLHTTKLAMLRGLGCAQDLSLIGRLLAMTLDENEVRNQDAAYVLRYASKFAQGQEETWQFLKTNWARLPAKFRGGMVTDVCSTFNTNEKLTDVRAFLTSLGPNAPEEISFNAAIARIQTNIQWVTDYSEKVNAALNAVLPDFL